MNARKQERLEVHDHCYVRGPNATNTATYKFSHSHPGGSEPHQHADTGPAAYVIDKTEWERTAGLKGGGKKKYTAQPTGPQLPVVELEDWQKTFEIIVVGDGGASVAPGRSQGAGIAPVARMVLGHKMTPIVGGA